MALPALTAAVPKPSMMRRHLRRLLGSGDASDGPAGPRSGHPRSPRRARRRAGDQHHHAQQRSQDRLGGHAGAFTPPRPVDDDARRSPVTHARQSDLQNPRPARGGRVARRPSPSPSVPERVAARTWVPDARIDRVGPEIEPRPRAISPHP